MAHLDEQVALPERTASRDSGFLAAASPWFWGGVMTWGFCLAIPHLPVYSELLTRYVCGHEINYTEAALFFVGLSILIGKVLSLGAERRAAAQAIPSPQGDLSTWCAEVEATILKWPAGWQSTRFAARLDHLSRFLGSRKSAEGLDTQAHRFADEASDDLFDSYALLQTITWAIPILGFLGTVIGITMAIANLTPEQLESSLSTVTGGLGVAFDTTAEALVLSMVLVFGYLYVKKAEQSVLSTIDSRVSNEIVACLSTMPAAGHPLIDAEAHAAQHLLERTESLIQKQTKLWKESVEGLRQRWTQTLDVQQQELATSLSGGMRHSLDEHASALESCRAEFLTAWHDITEEAARQFHEARRLHDEQQQQLQTAWADAWKTMRDDLASERTNQSREAEQWIIEFGRQVQTASLQLNAAAQASREQSDALARQTELLARIVDQEENLAGLQTRLTENLETLRAAENFEETLHSLNAAIHLMTARTRPKAA